MYSFFIFSAIFNALISLCLGIFVLSKNINSRVNKIFAFLCLSVAVWSFFYIGWPLSRDAESTLFWFRLLHIGASFTPIAYFHFVTSWLGIEKKGRVAIVIGYVLSFIFSFLSFSPYFIMGMVPKFQMRFWAEPGIIYHFYLLYFFFYFVSSSVLLYLSYKKSFGIKKKQVFYITLGTIFSIIGGSTNYFLWYDINIPPYGNILAGSFVIFSAYAIIRYRFMDIRIVAKRSFMYFSSALFTFFFLSLSLWLFESFFSGYSGFSLSVASAVLAAVFTIIFYYLEVLLKDLADKRFFSDIHNYEETVRVVAQELTRHNDAGEIADLIFDTIKKTIPVRRIGVFSLMGGDFLSVRYQAIKISGFDKIRCQKILKDDFFIKYLEKTSSPLVTEELPFLSETSAYFKNKNQLLGVALRMNECKASVCLPLMVDNKVAGMVLLGRKLSGDSYNKEDLMLLSTLADQAGIALNNAMLYQCIKKFGKELQGKVDEQTKELKKKAEELEEKNKNLNKLLGVKNEFLKIVNHQINTPLSIIKNSVFMVRNKSFSVEKGLSFVEKGAKRIDDVLNEFWKAFYVGGEGVKLKPRKIDLVRLASKTIKDYATADKIKDGRIVINFIKDDKIPLVKADPVQLSQVFGNLIDNSLCYTKSGSIDVNIKRSDNFIKVFVSDTGQGIEKNDIKHIFEKFFRSAAAKKTQPSGSGLGLYIIKKIVEAGGGVMKLERTEVDKGTTFSFTVPIWKK